MRYILSPDILPAAEEEGGAKEVHAFGIGLKDAAEEEEGEEEGEELPVGMGLTATAAAQNGDEQQKVEGVEKEDLKVDAHGGVLGEDHNKQDDACKTGGKEQKGIEPQKGANLMELL